MAWNDKIIVKIETIGNSGFELVRIKQHYTKKYPSYYKHTTNIRNINTKEIIFTLSTPTGWSSPPTRYKNFLGLDNRYYHIIHSPSGTSWGSISTSGAVISKNRTILKHISFYPVYQEGLKKEPKIPDTPPIDVAPKVVTLFPKPKTVTVNRIMEGTFKEDVNKSWLEKIKELIKKIKIQIKTLINKILTL